MGLGKANKLGIKKKKKTTRAKAGNDREKEKRKGGRNERRVET